MTQFILIHGAWHGGWCWQRVAEILRSRGHRVSAPTLTGLGERKHQLDENTGLAVFETDLIHHVEMQDLTEMVVVGHSFGGWLATILADRLTDRCRNLVILDGDIAKDGHSVLDVMPVQGAEERRRRAIDHLGVRCMPVPPISAFAIPDPEISAWAAARLVPHPIKSYEDKTNLRQRPGAGLPGGFIHCHEPDYGLNPGMMELASQIGMTHHRLATGHDAMLSEPNGLADLLEIIGQ